MVSPGGLNSKLLLGKNSLKTTFSGMPSPAHQGLLCIQQKLAPILNTVNTQEPAWSIGLVETSMQVCWGYSAGHWLSNNWTGHPWTTWDYY